MAKLRLAGKNIVILMTDGYYEHEYLFPYYRFLEEGAKVITAGLKPGTVFGEGNDSGTNGLKAQVDVAVTDLKIDEIDVLFIPGGLYSPMWLRPNENVQKLVRECFERNILVCTICHAPWILVSAGVLKGRKITCPYDMSPDVTGAGAEYLRQKVVVDGNLLSADGFRSLPEMFRTFFDVYFPD